LTKRKKIFKRKEFSNKRVALVAATMSDLPVVANNPRVVTAVSASAGAHSDDRITSDSETGTHTDYVPLGAAECTADVNYTCLVRDTNSTPDNINTAHQVTANTNNSNNITEPFYYDSAYTQSAIYDNKVMSSATYDNKVESSATYDYKVVSSATYDNKVESSATYDNKVESSATYDNKVVSSATYDNKVVSLAIYDNKMVPHNNTTEPSSYDNNAAANVVLQQQAVCGPL
jgi:hypothetical protein